MNEVQVVAGGLWCDSIAEVDSIQWSTIWDDGPSGCDVASWRMLMDPNEQHPELSRGEEVEIRLGPVVVWSGLVSDISRDAEAWTITATGWAREASHFETLAWDDLYGGEVATTVPRDAAEYAIERGWGVTSPSEWPAGAIDPMVADDTAQLNKLSTLLTAFCEANGLRWGVSADRELWFREAPTEPTWLTTPTVRPMGVADDDYVSRVYVRYVDGVDPGPPVSPISWATAVAVDADAELQWGRREEYIDLANRGLMTSGEAISHANAVLAKSAGRMGWTSALEVTDFELTDMYGLPVAFEQIEAGDMLRIAGTFDTRGNLTAGFSVDVVLAEVRYQAGASSIYLAPVGLVPRNFVDVLADAPPPEEELVG